MNETWQYPGLALLPAGKILAVTGHPFGGKDLASAEIYDPSKDEWMPTGSLRFARGDVGPGGLIMLSNGKVLISGGGYQHGSVGPSKHAELFDPATGSWSEGPPLQRARNGHRAITLADSRILIAGGFSGMMYLSSCEIYVP